MRKARTIFVSAGEPSGDLHGANLIRQFPAQAADVEVVGYGGPNMAAAGCRLHADLTELAVMWFARALWNLPRFWDLVSRADRFFRHHRPDAVVLIDYPGFNWWMARRAKVHGIPVFYYMPPQIWAWAQWRVKKMRRLVDHVLCNLPFEEAWLRAHGCHTTLVGHPFFDDLGRRPLCGEFLARQRQRPGPLVLILPGSRSQEISHNFPWLLKAAAQVRQAVPAARLAVGAFREDQAETIRRAIAAFSPRPPLAPTEVYVGKTPELMHLADCAMACSGSVSLELLYHATPTVILYWISRPAFFVQRFFRKVKYITLVNLLAGDGGGKEVFPEYLTCEDRSAEIAGHVIEWLADGAKRQARVAELERLRDKVARSGAAGRAAAYVLEGIGGQGPGARDRGPGTRD